MVLLDDNLMEKEEKELRKLLPISALLHNCLVLALSKVTIDHSLIKRQIPTFLENDFTGWNCSRVLEVWWDSGLPRQE